MIVKKLTNVNQSDLEGLKVELSSVKNMLKHFHNVIECSYDGMYITDGYANTIKVNKAYETITGMKRNEMIGKNMADLEARGDISKSATLVVLKQKKSVTIHQEFKTGKKALVSSSPIFDEKGEIAMVVTNVRDITELYELKEQIEKNKKITERYHSAMEALRKQLLDASDIIAEDEEMLNVLDSAKRVAGVDTTVLLLGETGVGKEEVAKYVHKNSKRFKKNFIKINCGAIPENLIESELFGYEKGAFTGASKDGKLGLFEVADGGTIFLDEVGELPLDMQVKLLRVLQDGEIKRVGAIKNIKIDVRILAATNRNLLDMINKNIFREDLYYRLSVVPITIPPLRKRKNDIEPLVENFMQNLNKKYDLNKTITTGAMKCLYRYNWPGNVRELKNIIERVVIMSRGDHILRSDLPIDNSLCDNRIENEIGIESVSLKDAVESLESKLIHNAFEKHGNVRSAAKELGIDASTFVRKRKKYEKKQLLQT